MTLDITLDCRKSLAELHTQLAQELSFPVWYGNNLDALHDCLTSLMLPVTIHLQAAEQQPKLLRVLLDSAAENDDLKITLE